MKKIVGIIAALALAGSVFADPDIVPAITSFKGDATLEWIADLDAETTGMKNSESAEFKIKFINEGTKVTSGDGLWGEIKIKGATKEGTSGTPFEVSGVSVEAAKIHFIDGDMYFNMDIRKPGFGVGKIGWVRAIYSGSDKGWSDASFGDVGGGYKYGTDNKDYQGFTLNFGLPIVDLTFAFGDNGQQKADNKEFAWKAAATLKPIDGLSLYAGATGCTADEYKDLTAVAVAAGYNYKIDDQFYLKPAVQFAMVGKKMDLSAAVFFGWGAGGGQWKSAFLKFTKDSINVADNSDRTTDGLSVLFVKNLKDTAGNDAKTSELAIEAYDGKLLGDFGVTWGAAYRAKGADENLGKGALSLAAIYNTNIDIVYLTGKVSFGMDLAQDKDNIGVKYGLRVGTKELIANTDLYLDYVGCFSKYAPEANAKDGFAKGTVTLGTKISF